MAEKFLLIPEAKESQKLVNMKYIVLSIGHTWNLPSRKTAAQFIGSFGTLISHLHLGRD